jgi:hypothetical protein
VEKEKKTIFILKLNKENISYFKNQNHHGDSYSILKYSTDPFIPGSANLIEAFRNNYS